MKEHGVAFLFALRLGDNRQSERVGEVVGKSPLGNGAREVESETSSNYPISPCISDPIHSRPPRPAAMWILAGAAAAESVRAHCHPRRSSEFASFGVKSQSCGSLRGERARERGKGERIRKWSISHVFALCTGGAALDGERARASEAVSFSHRERVKV